MDYAKQYNSALGSSWSYVRLADAYARVQDFESGLKTLREAQQFYPDDVQIATTMADLYIFMVEYDKAEMVLKQTIERQSENVKATDYFWLASFYPYQGKYSAALQLFAKMIELSWEANDTTAVTDRLIYKAFYYIWGWRDFEKAWIPLQEALEYKSYIPYWANVIYLYILRGDYDEAEKLSKKETWEPVRLLFNLWLQCKKNECSEAETIFRDLRSTLPKFMSIWALYPLAECQFESGQLDLAIENLRQIQLTYDNAGGLRAVFYPKSLYLLGKIYEKNTNKELAIEYYQKLLNIWRVADKDIPELIDTKVRLAKLQSVTNK